MADPPTRTDELLRVMLKSIAVDEVCKDIQRKITEREVEALRTSLRLRRLRAEWDRNVGPLPTVGTSWGLWLDSLTAPRFALRLLADAGVLGTDWLAPARDRFFELKGWR